MRDGVVLRADIYRPKQEGRFPVLLQRTPYNKAGGEDFGMRAAAAGYVAIIQACAGDTRQKANGIRSSGNRKMASTRWNGRLHCPMQTEKLACGVDLMLVRPRC